MKSKYPISAKGIVFENKKVWLRKNERNEWELPGGRVEKNEKISKSKITPISAVTGKGLKELVIELLNK